MANVREYTFPRKRYKVWEENINVSIPVRNRQRWDKKIALSIPCMDEGDNDTNETETNKTEQNFTQSSNISRENNYLSRSSDICRDEISDNEIYEYNYFVDDNHDYEDDIAALDNISNAIDVDTSLYDEHSIDFDESTFCTSYSNDEHSIDFNKNTFSTFHCNNENVLFNNSAQTINETVYNLINLYMKHRMTKSNLRDMLVVINNMLPQPNLMPKTVHKLFYYVQNIVPSYTVIKHFYCKKCILYKGVDTVSEVCKSCLVNENSFFFEIDIIEQIKCLFEYRNLASILETFKKSSLNSEFEISDIMDGSEYKRINFRQNRGEYDLTLMLNTDGLSLIKSSKSNCWPVMFQIMELPQHLREQFIIIGGLWYDNQKPVMNTFLHPFCLKLHKCFQDGINWLHPQTKVVYNTKIIVPLIIADAPARAQILNTCNFNGQYGCNICEIETQKCSRIEGKKIVRIYPFVENSHTLRTNEKMIKQSQIAFKENIPNAKGIKGPTIISILPFLDLGTCVIPEYMHSVLLGTVKQFLNIWLQKDGPWNIKKYLNQMDNYLLQIKPPNTFNRLPRSLNLIHFYKASEYYNWLLYYSIPTLKNYLPTQYFQHWLLLVMSIFILLKRSINLFDIEDAEYMLKMFVKQIPNLYSDRELTYNVHQLLHLGICVKRWGPLWATSAFPFENYNGKIANLSHASKNIGQEIINNLTILYGVTILKSKIVLYKEKTGFVEYLDKNISDSLLTDQDKNFLHQVLTGGFIIYGRANIKNEIFTSEIYYRHNKTNNYTVQITSNSSDFAMYGTIRFFVKANNVMYIIFRRYKIIHTKIFYHHELRKQVKHILPVEISINQYAILKLTNIKTINKVIKVGDYICNTPNLFHKIM